MLKDLVPIADKLKEERSLLNRELDSLTEEQAAQIHVNPDWTIKDALAHLVGAERGMTRMAQRYAEGENPQLPEGYNNDEYNARQVAKRKELTLAQLRAEMDASRAELMSNLENLTPEQLQFCGEHPIAGEISLKDLLVVIYTHETTHCAEITNKIRESKK